ncbi:response regulator transcription factor [uncultured Winogradskyella sp.]|uniref:response regulator transcription factor n=1 Tax=uncultured Winogradskyella sp. TaxID=395353 RepID=UPI002638E476|nr:LuxR C-terminal-related transcriptional regulator [uncultured Winogradskyella sp.]
MKTLSAHKKIIVLLKQLEKSNKELNIHELLDVLENLKNISTDKNSIEIIITSIKSLKEKELLYVNKLTDRESEIILLISKGLQNTEMAIKLNLSKSTIETHRKNIRKKLKLKGNDSLFAFALIFSLQNYRTII